MKWLELEKRLAEKNITVFTVSEFRRVMDMSETAAQKLLERYAKKGILLRLRKGLYAIKADPPSSYLISNKLYRPSYVSFESALSHHGLIPETVYGITAATTKPTRNFQLEGKSFTYHKIKKSAYTGYEPVKIEGRVVLLASPEKALIDYLYFVNLGRKPLYERLSIGGLSRKKLLENSRLFNRPGFYKWIRNDFLRNN
jgi:predicted transcriptional regulator of viral defense system